MSSSKNSPLKRVRKLICHRRSITVIQRGKQWRFGSNSNTTTAAFAVADLGLALLLHLLEMAYYCPVLTAPFAT
jgi:hypothetical protein